MLKGMTSSEDTPWTGHTGEESLKKSLERTMEGTKFLAERFGGLPFVLHLCDMKVSPHGMSCGNFSPAGISDVSDEEIIVNRMLQFVKETKPSRFCFTGPTIRFPEDDPLVWIVKQDGASGIRKWADKLAKEFEDEIVKTTDEHPEIAKRRSILAIGADNKGGKHLIQVMAVRSPKIGGGWQMNYTPVHDKEWDKDDESGDADPAICSTIFTEMRKRLRKA